MGTIIVVMSWGCCEEKILCVSRLTSIRSSKRALRVDLAHCVLPSRSEPGEAPGKNGGKEDGSMV